MQIQTTRLLLREFRDDDLAAFHSMLSDPMVMEFAPTPPHETLEQTQIWLNRRLAVRPPDGEDFVIEYAGRPIGKAGFLEFPEIGFLIGTAFWGKGLAGEAVRAAIDRGFAEHRLDRVTARVDPANTASLRLLAKLGFVETGRQSNALLVGGEWRDDVLLEVTAGQWR